MPSPTRSPISSASPRATSTGWSSRSTSYAPGPKDFDFDVNQISITPKRAEAVDFSAPYYVAEQAIVALKDSDFANATSLADFADATIGVQIGTTSQEAVDASIAPSTSPKVFDTSNDVVTALKNEQVDAVVVDVPTAYFLTAVQVPEGKTVASPAPAATNGVRCCRRIRRSPPASRRPSRSSTSRVSCRRSRSVG